MTLRERLERAKQTVRFAGQVLGVGATMAVLAILWVTLHAAERDRLEDALAAHVPAG